MTFESAVIVGASLAGAKAAETLRAAGFEGRITLIGEEAVRPYERPPLSKGYLRGEAGFEDAAVHPEGFYADNDIDLRTSTTVTTLHPYSNEVEITGGERIAYSSVLLSTGAVPRRLSVPGAELKGVKYLRSVADADDLHEAIVTPGPIVIIGAGWIGAEVAASAHTLGADVTVVDVAAVPLEKVLGVEMGAVYRDLHVQRGVKFRLGVGIECISGSKTVEAVRLTDG